MNGCVWHAILFVALAGAARATSLRVGGSVLDARAGAGSELAAAAVRHDQAAAVAAAASTRDVPLVSASEESVFEAIFRDWPPAPAGNRAEQQQPANPNPPHQAVVNPFVQVQRPQPDQPQPQVVLEPTLNPAFAFLTQLSFPPLSGRIVVDAQGKRSVQAPTKKRKYDTDLRGGVGYISSTCA